jgi:hypothetical protein
MENENTEQSLPDHLKAMVAGGAIATIALESVASFCVEFDPLYQSIGDC